ncbi:alpha/beta hydrolase family protein [Candidatus Bipolaricaulota bacterium]
MQTRIVLVSYIIVLLIGFCATAQDVCTPDPEQPGPLQTALFETQLEDEARNRGMELLVIYPNDPALQSAPLILFNHGFLLHAEVYRSYGGHLASHGFVVAMPSFAMTFFNVNHAKLAEDVRFVLDYCLAANEQEDHPLFQRIDENRIGASGNSLGGKLSLLEAVTDPRIRAIGVLDPVDTGNPIFENPRIFPSVAPELMPEIYIPLLIVGSELGKEMLSFSPCAPEKDNYQRFYEAANAPAIEITQLDVGHGQYTDPGADAATMACVIGDVDSEWVRRSSRAYLTAFFRATLLGDSSAMTWLEEYLAQQETAGQISLRRK